MANTLQLNKLNEMHNGLISVNSLIDAMITNQSAVHEAFDLTKSQKLYFSNLETSLVRIRAIYIDIVEIRTYLMIMNEVEKSDIDGLIDLIKGFVLNFVPELDYKAFIEIVRILRYKYLYDNEVENNPLARVVAEADIQEIYDNYQNHIVCGTQRIVDIITLIVFAPEKLSHHKERLDVELKTLSNHIDIFLSTLYTYYS